MEYVSVDKIRIGKYRVRTTFDEEKMRSLVASIKNRKILSPIWVKPPDEEGFYELIAGERRLRAARQAGLRKIPINMRDVEVDEAVIEMGIENIQREELSYYERGRWVAKMKDIGWPILSLSEETGIPETSLHNWFIFYEESERIKKVSTVATHVEELPLRGLLEVKRAPIPTEKKTELAIEATRMDRPPRVSEIGRATRILEQEPELPAREALERARGITLLLSIPTDLMGNLKDHAADQDLSVQDAIISILRRFFE